MRLSIIIPTYNRCALLARTLPTVFAQEFSACDREVIVVVDGSTDATLEMLRGFKPSCAFHVLCQPNRGQAAAKNAGAKIARGNWILYLDDDIVCPPDLLSEHEKAHLQTDKSIVFGPVLVHPESSSTVATDIVSAWTEDYYVRLNREGGPRIPEELWVGANCSLAREEVMRSGGFAESMRHAHEDAELAIRLWKSGLHFRYARRAIAHQIYVKSPQLLVSKDAGWSGRNEVVLSRSHQEYRPHASLARLGGNSLVRWILIKSASVLPFSPEFLLRPIFAAVDVFSAVPAMRHISRRLLQIRWRIETVRAAVREVGSWGVLRREFGTRLPVLCYHHVGPPRLGTYPELTVSPKQFERHVAWMARHGYIGITPSDWVRWLRTGQGLPEKPVLVTLDDAYADIAVHALPVLRRHGFGAAVFVPTGLVGGTNTWDEGVGFGTHRLMTEQEIRYWSRHGIEFGAHSRTHADLTATSAAELDQEIAGSKQDLENIAGCSSVTSFAYPYGYYNDVVRDCIQGAFALAFSTDEGLNDLGTDPLVQHRVVMLPNDSLFTLACRLRWGFNPIHRLRARVRLRSRLRRMIKIMMRDPGL